VLSVRCWRKFFSAIGLDIPAFSILRLVSSACPTRGPSHCFTTVQCPSFLSRDNSNNGHIGPRRPRLVIFSCAISNACANDPHVPPVADPFGPISVSPGTGSDADSVSKFFPNKNSDAASRLKRPYRSCASQAVLVSAKEDKMEIVWAQCRSNISKSEMRSLAKKGRARLRC